jgi:hypothetical protein
MRGFGATVMKKIPVGATIAHGYHFGFFNFPAVLRAIWVPLAVQLALFFVLMGGLAQFMTAAQARDPAGSSILGELVLLYPLILIPFFAQVVSVMELTLGQRTEIPLFYFPLGRKFWRLLGGCIVAFLAIVALMVVASIIIFVLALAMDPRGSSGPRPWMAVGLAIFFLLLYGGMIFVSIRLYFLLAPVNVAEQQLGVRRAWLLSRGNFWRAFLIVVAILLPMIIVEYTVIFAAIGLPPIPHGGDAQAYLVARTAWYGAMFSAFGTYWYVSLPMFGVIMVLYMGVTGAAQTFAYRALTEDEASAVSAFD